MKEFIKKYVYHMLMIILTAGAVWLATIDSKTFDSPEQKVKVVNAVETMPSEADRAVEIANDAHAIEIRQLRYEDNKRRDSIKDVEKKKHDSLTIDAFKRFTVQIEQIEAKLDSIEH